MSIRQFLGVGLAFVLAGCGPAPSAGTPGPTATNAAPSGPTAPPSATLPSASPPAGSDVLEGAWTSAAQMHLGRVGSDAVLLANGSVLVVGNDYACQPGGAVPGSERAELYDPGADTWTEVGSLNKARKTPATVALRDGRAITMGGINPDDFPFSSTKVFSPVNGSWTDGPLLNLARGIPLAVALRDGRVLITSQNGGVDFGVTVEILDPAISTWTRMAAPGPAISFSHLVVLDDGKVLAIGTDSADSDPVYAARLYDPARDLWEPVPAPMLRPTHLLAVPNGAVVLGYSDESELNGGSGGPSRAVGSYLDRAVGQWVPIAAMPAPRFEPQAVALPDGRILVAGGRTSLDADGTIVTTTEIYDPVRAAWATTADLGAPRQEGHALLLPDGSVLVLGGSDQLDVFGETPFCPPGITTAERFRLTP